MNAFEKYFLNGQKKTLVMKHIFYWKHGFPQNCCCSLQKRLHIDLFVRVTVGARKWRKFEMKHFLWVLTWSIFPRVYLQVAGSYTYAWWPVFPPYTFYGVFSFAHPAWWCISRVYCSVYFPSAVYLYFPCVLLRVFPIWHVFSLRRRGWWWDTHHKQIRSVNRHRAISRKMHSLAVDKKRFLGNIKFYSEWAVKFEK